MKPLLISAAALSFFFTTSCNTFIGMGRDLRQLGQGMENSANKSKTPSTEEAPQQTGGAPVY